jgi:hypothetical protein
LAPTLKKAGLLPARAVGKDRTTFAPGGRRSRFGRTVDVPICRSGAEWEQAGGARRGSASPLGCSPSKFPTQKPESPAACSPAPAAAVQGGGEKAGDGPLGTEDPPVAHSAPPTPAQSIPVQSTPIAPAQEA